MFYLVSKSNPPTNNPNRIHKMGFIRPKAINATKPQNTPTPTPIKQNPSVEASNSNTIKPNALANNPTISLKHIIITPVSSLTKK